MGLMAWIGKGMLGLAKLIALPFAKLGCPRVRPYVRWTLHIVCVIAIVACLAWLNAALHLDKVVRAPSPMLRAAWLPLLFVFVYSLAWMAWWLWRVATSPAEQSPHPDIDECWRDGLRALEQAKIDLLQTPIYLLVGGAAQRIEGLMQATSFTWEVPLTPKRATSPLRMCATHDAIFVDLSNISTTGTYTSRLLAQAEPQTVASSPAVPVSASSSGDGGVATMAATATVTATQRTAQRGLELIEQSLALLEREKTAQAEVAAHLDGVRIDDEELDAAQHRLAHACQLLADERAPFCAANGVVALIAWETTATQATANRAAVLFDRDLQTIHAELGLAVPRIALVTDVETAQGGHDLVARMPPDQRQRRFGVRFPRLADADIGAWPRIVEDGVTWLTRELLPALAYRVLRTGGPGDDAVWQGNANIFRFLNSVREREARLVRLLQRGLLPTVAQTSLGGLFFSSNPQDNAAQQAFLPGVMPQVLEMQNEVAWSPRALANDARARRWTIAGYATLALVLTGFVAAIVAA